MAVVYLSLKQAKPGMKLAEDVYTDNGKMILCKKDTILTESIIQRLENIGVEKVAIEQKMTPEEEKALLEEKLRLIEQVFENKEGECTNMLKNALIGFWKSKFKNNETY